jgi:hypothetical protein
LCLFVSVRVIQWVGWPSADRRSMAVFALAKEAFDRRSPARAAGIDVGEASGFGLPGV